MKLFSYKNRPFHLGPYPLERLRRQTAMPDLARVPAMRPVSYADDVDPESLVNAMARHMGMLDVVRDGAFTALKAEIPDDPTERANHMKAAGYYYDATMMGIAVLSRGRYWPSRSVIPPWQASLRSWRRASRRRSQPAST